MLNIFLLKIAFYLETKCIIQFVCKNFFVFVICDKKYNYNETTVEKTFCFLKRRQKEHRFKI